MRNIRSIPINTYIVRWARNKYRWLGSFKKAKRCGLFKTLGPEACDLRRCMCKMGVLNNALWWDLELSIESPAPVCPLGLDIHVLKEMRRAV